VSRGLRVSVLLLTAIALVGAGLFRAFVWPWIALPDDPPETIHARWAAVERRAATWGPAPAKVPRLRAAAAALVDAPDEPPPRPADPADPDPHPAVRRAVDLLVAWDDARDPVEDPCLPAPDDPPARLFHLRRLGALALHGSAAPDDLPFAAGLRLARELRRHGNLIAGMIGLALARDALDIARARGWTRSPQLADLRPTADELRALVAREFTCQRRLLEHAFGDDCRDADPPPWYVPLSLRRWCERERLVVEDFLGRRFARADAEPDLARFAAALADDPAARPSSLALDALTGPGDPLVDVVTRAAADLADHDAALAE
jgi:hypothetical protein